MNAYSSAFTHVHTGDYKKLLSDTTTSSVLLTNTSSNLLEGQHVNPTKTTVNSARHVCPSGDLLIAPATPKKPDNARTWRYSRGGHAQVLKNEVTSARGCIRLPVTSDTRRYQLTYILYIHSQQNRGVTVGRDEKDSNLDEVRVCAAEHIVENV